MAEIITELVASNALAGFIIIFVARVIDVSLGVFRLLFLNRGYPKLAALTGFFEVTVYIIALGSILSGGQLTGMNIVAYAGGYAAGNIVGAYIEEKMAVGYIVIQIFPPAKLCDQLVERLRAENFGVTRLMGEGRSGPREVLIVTAKRKDQNYILKLMNEMSPTMFFNISDARSIHGGTFPRRKASKK